MAAIDKIINAVPLSHGTAFIETMLIVSQKTVVNLTFNGIHLLIQLCSPGVPLSPKEISLSVVINKDRRIDPLNSLNLFPVLKRAVRRIGHRDTFAVIRQTIIQVIAAVVMNAVRCIQNFFGIGSLFAHALSRKGNLLHIPVHEIGRRKDIIPGRAPGRTRFIF